MGVGGGEGTVKQFRGSGGHTFFEVLNHYICHIFGNLRMVMMMIMIMMLMVIMTQVE